jgi:hypothetical protein
MALYVGKVRFVADGRVLFAMTDGVAGSVFPALYDAQADVTAKTRAQVSADSDSRAALVSCESEPVEVWLDVELGKAQPDFYSTASRQSLFLTGVRSRDAWADAWKRQEEGDSGGSPWASLV